MGEKGVGKLSRETPPPREGEPMGALFLEISDLLCDLCVAACCFERCPTFSVISALVYVVFRDFRPFP